jgi:hypothetical protein
VLKKGKDPKCLKNLVAPIRLIGFVALAPVWFENTYKTKII